MQENARLRDPGLRISDLFRFGRRSHSRVGRERMGVVGVVCNDAVFFYGARRAHVGRGRVL